MGAPTAPNRPARKAGAKNTTAAKKAAAAKKSTAPAGVFDLDSLTKAEVFPDLNLPSESFQFLLDGHDYELRDPRDTDWKLSLRLAGNPFLLMRTALVGADDAVPDPTEEELEAARDRARVDAAERAAERDGDGDEDEDETPAEEPEVKVTLIDRFTSVDLPSWKLEALFQRWHQHYKIDLSDGRGIFAALTGRG